MDDPGNANFHSLIRMHKEPSHVYCIKPHVECADPESFARGGQPPTMCFFNNEGERNSKYH